jgi:hypothetical protein
MRSRTIVSEVGGCLVDVLHDDTDPGVWIVRHGRKIAFFRKHYPSIWFNDRRQAMEYAGTIVHKHSHP